MRRKQKRYTKEFEITADILLQKRKAKLSLEKAERIEAEMHGMVLEMNSPGVDGARVAFLKLEHDTLTRKSQRLRRSIELTEDVRIPRLVRTLAAFKTMSLPGMGGEGVVLQK